MYKIVSQIDGEFVSAAYKNPHRLIYKVGEWTKPVIPNSPLLCFIDLEAADRFLIFEASAFANPSLFKIDVKNPRTPYCSKSHWTFDDLIDFWKKPNWGGNWPIGTMFADEIMLLEQI